jgi:murein DD-endopeptidase MepM/ murein hydrolase activator NlpD
LDDIRVSSEFGMRNGVKHKGIDLPAYHNAPIYTVLPGKVIFSGVQKGYGNVVIIQHTNTISTLYAHNDANLVKVNDIVFQGQMIGRIGKTGNTNAFHLHFEFRKNGIAVNPRELLESKVPIS